MRTQPHQQESLTFEKVWQMFQETDKRLQKLNDMYGGLSKNIGESAEEFLLM